MTATRPPRWQRGGVTRLVRPLSAIALGAALLSAGATPADAQDYGRWWWDARLSAENKTTSRSGGSSSHTSSQDLLRLLSALNGYLYDPALGDFRLELDLALTSVEDGRDIDSAQSGYGATLNILPRGAYPVFLMARRASFDYSGPATDDPLTTLRLPDSITTLEARTRPRRGPLKGFILGASRHRSELLDAEETASETRDRYFVDWQRNGRRARSHLRLERHRRDYELNAFRSDGRSASLNTSADLGQAWSWELIGRDSETTFESELSPSMMRRDRTLETRFTRSSRAEGSLLEIGSRVGRLDAGHDSTIDFHGARILSRWGLDGGWSIAPRLSYDSRRSDGTDVSGAGVGASASKQTDFGAVSSVVSADLTLRRLRILEDAMTRDEDTTSWSVGATISHGSATELHKELSVALSRSDFSSLEIRDSVSLPPGVAPERHLLGAVDRWRVRGSLHHAWDSRSIRGSVQVDRARQDGTTNGGSTFESLVGSVQWSSATWGLTGNAGSTRSRHDGLDEQEVVYAGGRASWRATRYLSLNASVQVDRRTLDVVADADSIWYDVGATLDIGLLNVGVHAYESRAEIEDAPARIRRGFSVSISRRFAGWLPIVTGVQRRGVIR